MLTGRQIRDAGLVIDGLDQGYRGSSYDVRIETIIADDGVLRDSFRLPAQGIAQVVSMERVRVPDTITGLAYVKTGLCNEGLLTLNIGVIDPGYHGKISSFLVNFSEKPRLLIRGETFLRLQFMTMAEPAAITAGPTDDQAYIDACRRRSDNFSSSFMNLEAVVTATTNELFSRWTKGIVAIVGSVALVLTLLTFLLNWGSLYLVKTWLQPADSVRADLLRTSLAGETDKLIKANMDLASRVEELENRMKSIATKPAQP